MRYIYIHTIIHNNFIHSHASPPLHSINTVNDWSDKKKKRLSGYTHPLRYASLNVTSKALVGLHVVKSVGWFF